jgi:uncharacterized membrane protein YjfL (UPF0719 family)
MESQDIDNLADVDNFTTLSEDEQGSVWTRFTGVEYDYAGLMNVILLVAIFLAAKYVFKVFIMSKKRIGKDTSKNFAYAISNFSFFVSLAFILTSVGYGDITTSWAEGAGKTVTYTVLGLILLIITGLIFDQLLLRKFSLNKKIAEGNIAAGVVDAGNFFSAALVISSSLRWQEFKQADAMIAIIGIYVVSQILLNIATYVRISLFNSTKNSIYFHEEIKKNNIAVAIDFAGRRIGTALAVTAATNLLAYQNSLTFQDVLVDWVAVSVILLIALNFLSWLASKIIFWQRNIYQDTLRGNISSALGDAAVYISFGVILSNCLY